MSDEVEGLVRKAGAVGDGVVFTEAALAAHDGKKVPLTDRPGGRVIGEATLKYVPEEKALKAEFRVDDPKVAEFLKGPPPNIFD